jgi:hypothetical protein
MFEFMTCFLVHVPKEKILSKTAKSEGHRSGKVILRNERYLGNSATSLKDVRINLVYKQEMDA